MLFWLTISPVGAQDSMTYSSFQPDQLHDESFEAEDWAAATADLDYGEAVSAPESEGIRLPSLSGGLVDILLWTLLIVAIAVLLIFLLQRLAGIEVLPRNQALRRRSTISEVALEELEEHLHEADLDGHLRQALNTGQYGLAIRLYYLAVLKALSVGGYINWKRDKTNQQYARELSGSSLAAAFREATYAFEWAWYGGHTINQAEYEKLSPIFERLVEQAQNDQPV